MREIVFDTETTGFDPKGGDRLVEVGCVELVNLVPTGNFLHKYVNPERDVPEAAVQIHGLTTDFLKVHPIFSEIIAEFLEFIGESSLVAHNAEFDMRFINWELENAGHKIIPPSRFIDTLQIARSRFPGAPNNLDALCKRLGVDNSSRTKHGALLDSEILAEVYLELKGGKQAGLELVQKNRQTKKSAEKKARAPRSFPPTGEELEAHEKFVSKIEEPVWLKQS